MSSYALVKPADDALECELRFLVDIDEPSIRERIAQHMEWSASLSANSAWYEAQYQ
jgi:hypothetical protein